MNKTIRISTPLDDKVISSLKAGDAIALSGVIYTARDQAHLRIAHLLKKGGELPVDMKGGVIYYCGPTPAKCRAIGACGPTTSGRMDPFTPGILDAGVKGLIGKGRRSEAVRKAIKKNRAVYLLAPGGAGAYLSTRVTASEVVAFEDLGPEAVYKLTVEDFPLVVGIDPEGNDIYG